MSVIINVRVKKEVKRFLEEAGVNVAEEVRNYSENLTWKTKVEKLLKK